MWGANSTLALLFGLKFFSPPDTNLVAQTPFGLLEGTSYETREGRTYYGFLGIPYAVPPVGDLRFKAPLAWNTTWEGVRDATSEVARCSQYHLIARSLRGSEDCLFLWIYSHNFEREGQQPIPQSDLKPVIVYIHGGMFMQGSGSFFKAKYLMDSDVVFVTMQYRVGALGFLNLNTEDVPGNQGLKDQALALQYVKDHIHIFGGDRNQVTLMGESAGGAASHLHMLSPMSKGLFQRVISQSGTALSAWVIQPRPVEQAKNLARRMGCESDDADEITDCLRKLDAKEISRSHMVAATILHDDIDIFGPTIETREDGLSEKFLPERPDKIIRSGNFTKVPWIVGSNSEEGILYAAPMVKNNTARREVNSNWEKWIPTVFRFENETNSVEIARKIKEFYLGNDTTAEVNMKKLPELIQFVTDRFFMEGMHHSLQLHKGQHPIYPYIYSYRGQFSFSRILLGMSFNVPVLLDFLVSQGKRWVRTKIMRKKEDFYGVSHGDELPLIFNLPMQDVSSPDHPDYEMSKTLVKAWATFAKTGVPPLMNETVWEEVSQSMQKVNSLDGSLPTNGIPIRLLKLENENIEMIDEPFYSRADFWKSLQIYPEREYYNGKAE